MIQQKFEEESKKKKKAALFTSPKGMHDILPNEQIWWDKVLKTTKDIAAFYNFMKIETTLLERYELFERGIGIDTDIVSKEMFFVKGGRNDKLVLRPEGTASIARAYLQHGLSHLGQPVKLHYVGSMFRRENPQAGRVRQHHQAGFEIIGGNSDPIYDAQIIQVFCRLIEQVKIKNFSIHVNSVGCRICRPHYRKRLVEYYRKKEKKLCSDCKRRLKTNPLRLLDCKVPSCQPFKEGSPSLMDNLCVSCSSHFKVVLEYLDELSLPYALDNYLVRGMDYYNRTVFEIFADGYDSALVAGGRYDYLIDAIGGRMTPGVGGAMGIERLIGVMKLREIELSPPPGAKVFLIYIGDIAKKKLLSIIEEFRKSGIRVAEAFGKDSLSKQMQLANKAKAELALIFGQKEVYEESIMVRDLKSGVQENVPLKKIIDEVKKRLK